MGQVQACASVGDLEGVKRSLQQQPHQVNSVDRQGFSALHWACYNNHMDVVR